jgi:Sec-independent protein translocase protein TatA
MNRFAQIKEIIDRVEEDFGKFYEKNNKAAGTRIRKAMQELKNLATEIRKEVQNMKNAEEENKKATQTKQEKKQTEPKNETKEKK